VRHLAKPRAPLERATHRQPRQPHAPSQHNRYIAQWSLLTHTRPRRWCARSALPMHKGGQLQGSMAEPHERKPSLRIGTAKSVFHRTLFQLLVMQPHALHGRATVHSENPSGVILSSLKLASPLLLVRLQDYGAPFLVVHHDKPRSPSAALTASPPWPPRAPPRWIIALVPGVSCMYLSIAHSLARATFNAAFSVACGTKLSCGVSDVV
jgi:hypothetical protein